MFFDDVKLAGGVANQRQPWPVGGSSATPTHATPEQILKIYRRMLRVAGPDLGRDLSTLEALPEKLSDSDLAELGSTVSAYIQARLAVVYVDIIQAKIMYCKRSGNTAVAGGEADMREIDRLEGVSPKYVWKLLGDLLQSPGILMEAFLYVSSIDDERLIDDFEPLPIARMLYLRNGFDLLPSPQDGENEGRYFDGTSDKQEFVDNFRQLRLTSGFPDIPEERWGKHQNHLEKVAGLCHDVARASRIAFDEFQDWSLFEPEFLFRLLEGALDSTESPEKQIRRLTSEAFRIAVDDVIYLFSSVVDFSTVYWALVCADSVDGRIKANEALQKDWILPDGVSVLNSVYISGLLSRAAQCGIEKQLRILQREKDEAEARARSVRSPSTKRDAQVIFEEKKRVVDEFFSSPQQTPLPTDGERFLSVREEGINRFFLNRFQNLRKQVELLRELLFDWRGVLEVRKELWNNDKLARHEKPKIEATDLGDPAVLRLCSMLFGAQNLSMVLKYRGITPSHIEEQFDATVPSLWPNPQNVAELKRLYSDPANSVLRNDIEHLAVFSPENELLACLILPAVKMQNIKEGSSNFTTLQDAIMHTLNQD